MNMNTSSQTETKPPTDGASQLWVAPRASIHETQEAYVIEAEMGGVTKEGVEVQLEDRQLTITGRQPKLSQGNWLRRESLNANYRRTFVLDPTIDQNRIGARMEQGVLTVVLPKVEAVKLRQIPVTG
jgi:HSP20 family protein